VRRFKSTHFLLSRKDRHKKTSEIIRDINKFIYIYIYTYSLHYILHNINTEVLPIGLPSEHTLFTE
jgi:hypothetical protein